MLPASEKEPLAQGVRELETVEGHANPAGHCVHDCCEPTLKYPGLQTTIEPPVTEGQAKPGEHAVHEALPAAEYVPAGQAIEMAWVVSGQ